jgi:hypothetical protein
MPTLSAIKKRFGFRPGTHFKTILANPKRLGSLLPVGASVEDVKATLAFLVRASPKEVSDRRARVRAEQQAAVVADVRVRIDHRAERARRRDITRQIESYEQAPPDDHTWAVTTVDDLKRIILGVYKREVNQQDNGFLMTIYTNGKEGVTRTLSRVWLDYMSGDTQQSDQSWASTSDDTWMERLVGAGNVTARIFRKSLVMAGREYQRRGGAYYGYELNANMFDGPFGHLAQEAAKLGCFPNTKQLPKMADGEHGALLAGWKQQRLTPCLYNAIRLCLDGRSPHILEAMKSYFKHRRIAQKDIRGFAEAQGIRIVVHNGADEPVSRYGPDDPEIAIDVDLVGSSHYIARYRTDITSFSLKNFGCVGNNKEWWKYIAQFTKRSDRGLMSSQLLKLLESIPGALIPITPDTHAFYAQPEWSQADRTHFEALRVDRQTARPVHPPRHAAEPPDEVEDRKELSAQTRFHNRSPEEAQRLQEKFKKLGFSRVERINSMNRLCRVLQVHATVFFDFETTTDGDRHSPYVVCAANEAWEDMDRTVHFTGYGDDVVTQLMEWALDEAEANYKALDHEEANPLTLR